MTVVFSLLVHENEQVVINQIENINKFAPGALIVAHVNERFNGKVSPLFLYQKENQSFFVNDQRLVLQWADLIQAHNSNFQYAKKTFGKFSHFCLEASNDMFVRPGVLNYVTQREHGSQMIKTYDDMQWTSYRRTKHDPQLKRMMDFFGVTEILGSQPEGNFYSYELYEELFRVIDMFFDHSQISNFRTKDDNDSSNALYPREEIYFPTLAQKLNPNPATPYVFSEAMVVINITPTLIESIRNETISPELCVDHRFKGEARLYYPSGLFAVKRVPRNMHSDIRKFINELP